MRDRKETILETLREIQDLAAYLAASVSSFDELEAISLRARWCAKLIEMEEEAAFAAL